MPQRVGVGVLVALAILGTCAPGCRGTAQPPSVLIVIVDTLRADRVGVLGSGEGGPSARPRTSSTPFLDRWASQAAVFRHATTPAPFTMPAMAALLSGRYPDRCGVVVHQPGATLRSWKGDTMPEAARRAGLATAAVVANPWLARPSTGFDRGFDHFEGLHHLRQVAGLSDAAVVTDRTIRLLEGMQGRRFFVWAHYFDPHMPYRPPAEFARAAGASPEGDGVMSDFEDPNRDLSRLYRGDGYRREQLDNARRLYDGEVRYADHEIGRLLDRLEGLGLAANTLVIVASDHGESLGEHGLFFAHDYTLYEELTHVALLLRGPGVNAGVRDDAVSLIDVAPTICRLGGLDCDRSFDGRDLFAVPDPTRTLFAATTPSRDGGTPFDRLQVPGLTGRWTMALRGSQKLIRIPTSRGARFERYDLARDPGETTSASDDAGLAASLQEWSTAMDAARPPLSTRSLKRRRDKATLRSLGYLQ